LAGAAQHASERTRVPVIALLVAARCRLHRDSRVVSGGNDQDDHRVWLAEFILPSDDVWERWWRGEG